MGLGLKDFQLQEIRSEMAIYDELPPVIRKAIAEADNWQCVVSVRSRLLYGGRGEQYVANLVRRDDAKQTEALEELKSWLWA